MDKKYLGDEISSEKQNIGATEFLSGGAGTQSLIASSYHSCLSDYN